MEKRCGGCFHEYDSNYDVCPHCGYYIGCPAKEAYFLAPGTRLYGRYTIGHVLGFGGFGITYKAWDNKLDSVVAIKEYYPSGIVNRPPGTQELILFAGEKRKEFEFGLVRFIDEARNMTKFNTHTNIVNVYEYFEENNTAYIVMEFLDGMNLSEYLDSNGGKLSLDFGLKIIFDISNALIDVHENGIIHRDISPDNIFMCNDGTIKLIDFGAARFSSEEAKSFTIILKPGFAPPEQYEQISDQGPKTDIYALGATLYYIITGVKPDESTNRKIKDVVAELNSLDSSIPQYINDSVLKAMAIEPHMRFESVDEFNKSLRKELKVTSIKKEKRKKKTKRFIGISFLAAVLTCVAAVFFINVDKKSEVVTLKPAEISMWYVAEKGSAVDTAYKSLVAEFCKEYDTVKITATCFSEKDYTTKLAEAMKSGKAPNLFVSNDLNDDMMKKAVDLRSIVFPDTEKMRYFLIDLFSTSVSKSCYFLKNYDTMFPEHKQIPASFNIPVIYANLSLGGAGDVTKITSLSDIEKYITADSKLIVNKELKGVFTQLFDRTISDNIIEGTKEQFLSGKYGFYFSDTSDFFDIRKMPSLGTGVPKTIGIDIKNLSCSYGTLWSVYGGSENQNAAAQKLLEFLLSGHAQSNVFGKSDSERAIPINKDAVSTFVSVYDGLEFITGCAENGTLN